MIVRHGTTYHSFDRVNMAERSQESEGPLVANFLKQLEFSLDRNATEKKAGPEEAKFEWSGQDYV